MAQLTRRVTFTEASGLYEMPVTYPDQGGIPDIAAGLPITASSLAVGIQIKNVTATGCTVQTNTPFDGYVVLKIGPSVALVSARATFTIASNLYEQPVVWPDQGGVPDVFLRAPVTDSTDEVILQAKEVTATGCIVQSNVLFDGYAIVELGALPAPVKASFTVAGNLYEIPVVWPDQGGVPEIVASLPVTDTSDAVILQVKDVTATGCIVVSNVLFDGYALIAFYTKHVRFQLKNSACAPIANTTVKVALFKYGNGDPADPDWMLRDQKAQPTTDASGNVDVLLTDGMNVGETCYVGVIASEIPPATLLWTSTVIAETV